MEKFPSPKPKEKPKSVFKSKENIEPTKAAVKAGNKKIDDLFKKSAKPTKSKVAKVSDDENDIIIENSDSDFELEPKKSKKKLMKKQDTFDMFKKVAAGPKTKKKVLAIESSDEEFTID